MRNCTTDEAVLFTYLNNLNGNLVTEKLQTELCDLVGVVGK